MKIKSLTNKLISKIGLLEIHLNDHKYTAVGALGKL